MKLAVSILTLGAAGCGAGVGTGVPCAHGFGAAPLDAEEHFVASGFRGSAAVLRNGTVYGYRGEGRFCPASTFKIPNALIALDLGIATPDRTIAWDGSVRAFSAWNRDHTLATAITYSVVWYFQVLAREIGAERYRSYLRRFRFGNGRVGDDINQFWLDDSLQVSATEQVCWWLAMHRGELGVQPGARAAVLRMSILARDEHTTLRGKTGWRSVEPIGGWFVGSLELGNAPGNENPEVVTFAVHLEADAGYDQRRFRAARREVAEAILRGFGLQVPEG